MLTPNPALGLDRIDLRILDILLREGRITKADLAMRVNLSQTPCGARIEKMQRLGVIRGYHAEVDLYKLAHFSRYIVTIKFTNYSPDTARRFESILQEHPNILQCEAVLGNVDFVVTILASSVAHYIKIIDDISNNKFVDIDYTTYPVSRSVKRPHNVSLPELSTDDSDEY